MPNTAHSPGAFQWARMNFSHLKTALFCEGLIIWSTTLGAHKLAGCASNWNIGSSAVFARLTHAPNIQITVCVTRDVGITFLTKTFFSVFKACFCFKFPLKIFFIAYRSGIELKLHSKTIAS